MRKLTSIRTSLFLAMVLIVLIMSALFLPYGFYSNIKSVRNSVLRIAAITGSSSLTSL